MHPDLYASTPKRHAPLWLAIALSFTVHAAVVIGIRWQPALPLPADSSPLEVVLNAGVPPAGTARQAAKTAPPADRPRHTLMPPRPAAMRTKPAVPADKPGPRTSPAAATPPAPGQKAEPARHHRDATGGARSFNAGDLLADARALARTDSETAADRTGGSRRAVINAGTRDAVFASYAEDWRRKMERVGNLNYPQDARDNGLYGRLKLRVDIRADGSLIDVRIQRGSGHASLDEAAVRIVRLAAPFAPFPPALARDYDQISIIRGWNFTRDNQFAAGN